MMSLRRWVSTCSDCPLMVKESIGIGILNSLFDIASRRACRAQSENAIKGKKTTVFYRSSSGRYTEVFMISALYPLSHRVPAAQNQETSAGHLRSAVLSVKADTTDRDSAAPCVPNDE